MLEQTKEQILALKDIIRRLPLSARPEDTQQLEASLNQIVLDMAVFENEGHSASEKRDAIAAMRGQIRIVRHKLDELQTAVAELYRTQIGPQKEAFEALSEEAQRERHPQAADSRGTFHALVKASDLLSLITSYLLERSAELEKQEREASKKEPATAPAERFDQDPAPSSLSP